MGRASTNTLQNGPNHWEDKCCQEVKKVVLKIIENRNVTAGRKKHSGFDHGYEDLISHYMAWIGTRKHKYEKCIVEMSKSGGDWMNEKFVKESEAEDFFQEYVRFVGTQANTAKKYRYAIQKYMREIEGQRVSLKDNLVMTSSLTSQKERRIQYVADRRHLMDAHEDVPLKTLSQDRENKLLQIAWEYFNNDLSFLDGMMFIFLWNVSMATFMRFDSLFQICFEDMHYNVEEGPFRRKSESEIVKLTGCNFFEPAILLLMQACCTKTKKEVKELSGFWRHVDVFRCPVFSLATCFYLFTLNEKSNISFMRNVTKHEDSIRGHWQDNKMVAIAFECSNMTKKEFYEKARILCNKVFAMAGLEKPSKKVLHLGRVLGLNRAIERKAPREDATQMSGHEANVKDEADKSYFTKTPESVMLAMSGFMNHESWLVPRTFANFYPLCWIDRLFPNYAVWKQQHKHPNGDHTKASFNMLYFLLPQLGKSLIQDGKCDDSLLVNTIF